MKNMRNNGKETIVPNLIKFSRQFISYGFVGGVAAVVEWTVFWFCDEIINAYVALSTTAAFIIATFVNWVLGRKLTFKNNAKNNSKGKDAAKVFIVSGIGLGLNIALMELFVNKLHLYPMLSKIIATGMVFLWNFLSRKYIIYRE